METVFLAATGPITDPIGALPASIEHLLGILNPMGVFTGSTAHPVRLGVLEVDLSVNTIGFVLAALVVLWIGFAMKKRMTLVPKGAGVNAFEFMVEFVRNNIANIIEHDQRKYEPFLLTTFFFILIANLSGLIPNGKLGTGTIGGTFALAFVVFVYFNWCGIKEKGGWNYVKGIVPHGVPGWMAPIIWLIEVVSMCLRPVTLALRLWANMYAGHIMLGIFALLTGLFAQATFDGAGAYIAASPAWALLLFAIYVLELLVCAIGAFVFCLLTAVYINAAIGDH